MEKANRKSVTTKLSKYIYGSKDSDFIEMTEWTNGEGYDICIIDKLISLSYEELDAINHLKYELQYGE